MAKRDKPAAVLETKEVPLADLHPFPGNPRRSDIKMLRQSIRAHGVFRAMVVNQRTMEVLAGNHMLEALKLEGHTTGLVHLVDVDQDEARRIVLADNRASDLGAYDDMMLLDLLQALPDLSGTGYDDRALSRLLARDEGGHEKPVLGDALIYRVVVEVMDESEQAALLERFKAEGLRAKAQIS